MRFLSTRALGMGFTALSLTGLSLLGTAPAARAQSTYGPFTTTHTVTTQLTDFSDYLTFKKFDGSLGTLTGISFSLTSNITTNITVTNTASSTSSGNVQTEVDITLKDPNNLFPLDNQAPPQGTSGINLFANTSNRYTYSLAPGNTTPQSSSSGNMTSSATGTGTINMGTTNSAAIFTEFTGAANDTINVTGTTKTDTILRNTGGNTSASQVTSANFTGSITYTYVASSNTPEPGSLALVGSGLLVSSVGLGRRLRRRNK